MISEVEPGWVRICCISVCVTQGKYVWPPFFKEWDSYLFFRVCFFVFFYTLSSKVVSQLFGKVKPNQVLKIKCGEHTTVMVMMMNLGKITLLPECNLTWPLPVEQRKNRDI